MKWHIHSMGRFYDASESAVVYFDSHSGDTHLVSEFAAYIMRQFGNGPLSTEDILEKVSTTIESPGDRELEQAVLGVLEELVSLDILQRD